MRRIKSLPSKRPLIIIRLWPHHHTDGEAMAEMLTLLERHRAACDEVWFCTEMGYPTLEAHRRSAERMALAAGKVRALDILPGLQVANTIGHADMPLCPVAGIAWQPMVGPDGRSAKMSHCPREPAFLEYNRQAARAYAAWGPSSVWIDDDLRMHHHAPVDWGCFCDRCVSAFAREQGRRWNRRSLVKSITDPDDGRTRLAWTQFNGRALAMVARSIGQAVHEVAPDCRPGLQHAGAEWGIYNGPSLTPVFTALAEASGHKAGSRPGGGFYTDHQPREMLDKAFSVARQVALLPDCVDVVCPEIENFTHNAMGKTAHGTVVESSLDLAMGCNCLSYAILCSRHDTTDWYGSLLERIGQYRPFWRGYIEQNEGAVSGGLEVLFGAEHAARRLRPGEGPFAWANVDLHRVYQMSAIGVPLCCGSAGACGAVLHADTVDGLTDKELRTALSGGLLIDGIAAMRIQQRGFGDLLGVEVVQPEQLDFYERLTADKLNGPHAGKTWRGIFFGASPRVMILRPHRPTVRILGEHVNAGGEIVGAATVLADNELGGRVAIFGYDGFDNTVSSPRRVQLLAACDWLARGRLPVLIETPAQVAAVPRVSRTGQLRSVMLLNTSIDATPPLQVRLRGLPAGKPRWFAPQAAPRLLRTLRSGRQATVTVPSLPAWSVGYIGT